MLYESAQAGAQQASERVQEATSGLQDRAADLAGQAAARSGAILPQVLSWPVAACLAMGSACSPQTCCAGWRP